MKTIYLLQDRNTGLWLAFEDGRTCYVVEEKWATCYETGAEVQAVADRLTREGKKVDVVEREVEQASPRGTMATPGQERTVAA